MLGAGTRSLCHSHARTHALARRTRARPRPACGSGIVTTPLDVLKTRLMTQGTSGRYASLLDATLTIARTEGLGAFMSGWQPRLLWISLGGFVFFPALEAAKQLYSPDGRGMHDGGGHVAPPDTAFVIEELEQGDRAKGRAAAAAAAKKA